MTQQSHSTECLNDELRGLLDGVDVPADVAQAGARALSELARSEVAPGLPVGAPAPDFTLANATGRTVALSERRADGPVVVSFYRGAWCPFCNLELRALQHALPDITARGASLIAISQQTPDHSLSLADKHDLTFDVLSDLDGTVATAWKVRFPVSVDFQTGLDYFQIDLATENADGTSTLVVPATFVVDHDGVVRDRYASVDYTTRMEPRAILDTLDRLRG
ncbi:MAG: peroxiredoxin-like family protein [Pseudonocardia sp.]